MGGQDKGLLTWQGQPMALQVAQRLSPQLSRLSLNANRHQTDYAAWGWPVHADDPDLPASAGPLIGILTGLRRTPLPWLQCAPCDSPCLPADLVARLLGAAITAKADIAVPVTTDASDGQPRHHWTTVLVHRRARASLEAAVASGERRVRDWVAMNVWTGVSFGASADFVNFNTPEAFHGTP